MTTDPERIRVASARVDLTLAVQEIAKKHDLTDVEITFLLTEKIHERQTHKLRAQRKRKGTNS